ncbi:DUF3261 domain-containing protein [Myxococcus sp. K15C18031901]|uniref:DUF3261 domain-containing protein n=1 Tax=Myxococcus dinghuensis TaxID=2906761 RepID=UPI0020A74026|nr:DUF3261 domain-containing protein [Myxococcus dinghuensis]MCP3102404.1 DUF3261 domain-containing protein [Myxococcus dinghuensis]
MLRLIPVLALLGLSACLTPRPRPLSPAATLPSLMLPPASFGDTVSLAQQLSFAHEADPDGPRTVEALLELDPAALRLAGFALGQRMFSLVWNGSALEEERDPRLPEQFQARQVLRDVQLVYWPADVLRAALPPDWTLEDGPGRRALLHAGQEWVTVRYAGEPRWRGRAELVNVAEHYRLTIESRPTED